VNVKTFRELLPLVGSNSELAGRNISFSRRTSSVTLRGGDSGAGRAIRCRRCDYDIPVGGKAVALGRAIVTVMQSAQTIMGKHVPRGYAASSAPRRSLS